MTSGVALKIINGLWVVWMVYWLVAGLRVKSAKQSESPASRGVYIVPLIFSFILIFAPLWPGFLPQRFVAAKPWIEILAVATAAAGMALAVWARFCLGTNWSARVSIKEGHELVRRGPYARVRHPIYSGVLLSLAGTALAVGEWRAVVGLALAVVSFVVKARKEDAFLAREFGEAFTAHKRRSGMLLPRVLAAKGSPDAGRDAIV